MAQEYTDQDEADYYDQQELKRMLKTQGETTNCKSEEGITVGLIDSLMTISSIVNQRLKMLTLTPAIEESLKDLGSDKDLEGVILLASKIDCESKLL